MERTLPLTSKTLLSWNSILLVPDILLVTVENCLCIWLRRLIEVEGGGLGVIRDEFRDGHFLYSLVRCDDECKDNDVTVNWLLQTSVQRSFPAVL